MHLETTVDKQLLSGVPCTEWPAFHAHIAAELVRLNERLPSRAKACRGQIPLASNWITEAAIRGLSDGVRDYRNLHPVYQPTVQTVKEASAAARSA